MPGVIFYNACELIAPSARGVVGDEPAYLEDRSEAGARPSTLRAVAAAIARNHKDAGSAEEKRVKDLFDKERRAVAAGKDRQPFIAEREGLSAEARKRGPRMPSDASMAYAAAVKAPSIRRPRDRDRNRDVKKRGMTGLPSVVERTR